MQRFHQLLVLAFAAAAISGCQGAQNTLDPNVNAAAANGSLFRPAAKAGTIQVADPKDNAVLVFPTTGNGNIAPSSTLAGSKTQLASPAGAFLAPNGKLYVTSYKTNAVDVYAAGASGNTAPSQQIVGHKTGLSGPVGIWTDAKNNIYVANSNLNTITVYRPQQTGT